MHDFFDIIRPTWLEREPRLRLELDWNGIHIELFGTNHVPEQASSASSAFITHGLHIDGRVFFSGDTKFDRELLDMYADRSEYMFHDASFFSNPVHASIEELRTLPASIKEKMFLVHYGDAFAEHSVEEFKGFAQKGMRYIFD